MFLPIGVLNEKRCKEDKSNKEIVKGNDINTVTSVTLESDLTIDTKGELTGNTVTL